MIGFGNTQMGLSHMMQKQNHHFSQEMDEDDWLMTTEATHTWKKDKRLFWRHERQC